MYQLVEPPFFSTNFNNFLGSDIARFEARLKILTSILLIIAFRIKFPAAGIPPRLGTFCRLSDMFKLLRYQLRLRRRQANLVHLSA